ncbi:MAG: DUF4062 domain-containing protein, partial [Thiomargarita sp.]|nr:DUF4062 domain-containing protein [Thiomargarita sp.]
MKKFENREVRVFISSTFRGMKKEREVLVRHVFPEIHRRCLERGIGFVEVDLRWGITSEAVDQGLAVPICFQQIDHCQPFFIGLLGEYYGSIIPDKQKEMVCRDYSWIKPDYLDRSITELEITYGLFKAGQARSDEQHQALTQNALFYFRSKEYAKTQPENERKFYIEKVPEHRAKQNDLKQRLRDHPCKITEYQQPTDLKTLVLEPLWAQISEKFPDTPTTQERENFDHDAFADSRQNAYIKRPSNFERLNQHVQSDDVPLIIHGESGGGKTALLANWAVEYQEKHADELVFWHFCGSTPESTDPIKLLRRIMRNLK